MSEKLRYAVVTPARDEAHNVERLAASLAAQTRRPDQWLVVDNGSADDTPDVVLELARRHPWIRLVSAAGAAAPTRGGPVARAFMEGVAALESQPDVVVKMDADTSVDPDYFSVLLSRFAAEPDLGIAGGICLELDGGAWKPTHVTANRVRGAARAYRWDCLQAVLPLEDRPGWDGIDEMRAAAHGWRTSSIPELAFRHHRRVGERDASRWSRLFDDGRAAYWSRYRPSYLFLRSVFRSRREPASLAMIGGYVVAALRREPRCEDELATTYLREQQRLRLLPLRAREALGRRPAPR